MNTGLDEVLILNLVVFRAPGSEGAEGSGGIADGADLRVSRRVIVGSDSVGAGCDDFSVARYDCSEWAAAVSDVLHRKPYSFAHKIFVIHIHKLISDSVQTPFSEIADTNSRIIDTVAMKIVECSRWELVMRSFNTERYGVLPYYPNRVFRLWQTFWDNPVFF